MQTSAEQPSRDAILLIGPTGSGKTPLGQAAETAGLSGRRCVHFDFGQALRAAAASPPTGLADADVAVIRHVLDTGALLEDDMFHIAGFILRRFIETRAPSPNDIIVLNGLPRHIGQTRQLESILTIIRVVHLYCSPDTVFTRIHLNSGGDRTGRTDDTPSDIRRKLAIFEQRTAPLLEDFRHRGIPVITLEVTPQDDPTILWGHAVMR